ncbi:VWA domain-containing protein [Actinophytocola algeriensis]|uniref:Ca-activated chloride channel family protein n=1 Tax=Actinophytocola algeriensis TaxID=1768010 RepID=A0A7W7Q1X6_9PSEU|nr:VWA domain-containing protein [Actinophytocola algeriensis]MBB4905321.1 Ca-activated chloride channel family protein [Actinophytocola algeriensis]MBE1472994.1 Ca-activated chloride channel family protein [Actinophytocola algeriensis]
MRKFLVAVLAAVSLAGCTSAPESSSGPAVTLRVLAGSELRDMAPLLAEAAEETGVTVEMTYLGTLEGAETVASGAADGRYDAVWFSSTRYLQTIPEAKKRLANTTRIMGSPVVLGVREPAARRLGWDAKAPTWSEIAAAAERGEFTYGMTDPAASNTGFSALVAVAAALDGSGRALDAAAVDRIAPRLAGFFSGQRLTAGSSDWLSGSFVRRATGEDPGGPLDGLVNYESTLRSLNRDRQLPEPLTIVYPADGVISADYPFTLLAGASDEVRDGYGRLVDHLRAESTQNAIVAETERRAVVPNVGLPDGAPSGLVELPFPDTRTAIDALLVAYFDRLRTPARTVYVLDVSGSMAGERLAALKTALTGLTGVDTTLSGRYCRFRSREEVILLPFASVAGEPTTFTVSAESPQSSRDAIRTAIDGLRAEGETAVYDSLVKAYGLFADAGERFPSIVLMTDGESNAGRALGDFTSFLATAPHPVRVFPILFGEAAEQEMRQVASSTGGELWDARDGDLGRAFCQIRGYQ